MAFANSITSKNFEENSLKVDINRKSKSSMYQYIQFSIIFKSFSTFTASVSIKDES